jgi:hypothetical protein
MNTTIDNETKAEAIAKSSEIVQTSQDINNTLEVQGTRAFFGTHYANAELDVFGIVALVKHVLRENDSVFGRGIEKTELRQIAVAGSMFTNDIVAAVGTLFANAGMRYKPQAVKNVLSTYAKGEIVKIALSNSEDKPRPCSKPRAKWYLVSTPAKPQ